MGWAVPAFFVLPTPPRSVAGRGLGNQAAKLWHRTVDFSCSFLFRPADLPPLAAGGDLGIFCHSDCGAGLCDFLFFPFRLYSFASPPLATVVALLRFSLFRPHVFAPLPLLGDMAVIFLDFCFLPSTDRPPFFTFFLGIPCRLRSLADQRCGSGF